MLVSSNTNFAGFFLSITAIHTAMTNKPQLFEPFNCFCIEITLIVWASNKFVMTFVGTSRIKQWIVNGDVTAGLFFTSSYPVTCPTINYFYSFCQFGWQWLVLQESGNKVSNTWILLFKITVVQNFCVCS